MPQIQASRKMLTQEDKINVQLMKNIVTEKEE